MGALHWAPEQFWSATPMELKLAIHGLKEIQEPKTPAPGSLAPTREEIEDLKRVLGKA